MSTKHFIKSNNTEEGNFILKMHRIWFFLRRVKFQYPESKDPKVLNDQKRQMEFIKRLAGPYKDKGEVVNDFLVFENIAFPCTTIHVKQLSRSNPATQFSFYTRYSAKPLIEVTLPDGVDKLSCGYPNILKYIEPCQVTGYKVEISFKTNTIPNQNLALFLFNDKLNPYRNAMWWVTDAGSSDPKMDPLIRQYFGDRSMFVDYAWPRNEHGVIAMRCWSFPTQIFITRIRLPDGTYKHTAHVNDSDGNSLLTFNFFTPCGVDKVMDLKRIETKEGHYLQFPEKVKKGRKSREIHEYPTDSFCDYNSAEDDSSDSSSRGDGSGGVLAVRRRARNRVVEVHDDDDGDGAAGSGGILAVRRRARNRVVEVHDDDDGNDGDDDCDGDDGGGGGGVAKRGRT